MNLHAWFKLEINVQRIFTSKKLGYRILDVTGLPRMF